MTGAPTRAGRRLGLLLSGIVSAFLLAEVVARLCVDSPTQVEVYGVEEAAARRARENRTREELRHQERGQAGLWTMTPTGLRLRANVVAVVEKHFLSRRDVTIRTNSLGYRNPAIGAKEPRRPRVLFLGDSVTFGDWLAEEETFVRLVEQLAAARGEPLETINAAVGGIGLETEYAILVETGLGVEPDAVVLCFYLNDVGDSNRIVVRRPAPILRWSRLAELITRWLDTLHVVENTAITDDELAAWRAEVAARYPARPGDPLRDPGAFYGLLDKAINIRDWASAWSDAAWQRMEPVLGAMRRLADEHGFRLLFVCFPVRDQVAAEQRYDEPQQRLRAVGARLGVPVLDVLPVLRAARSEGADAADLFHDQCHHTVLGNRIVAEAIEEFLQQHLR